MEVDQPLSKFIFIVQLTSTLNFQSLISPLSSE